MSGFWSFREFGTGTGAAARSASRHRLLDLAVTQVLPVGVEFKRTALSTAQEDAHARYGEQVAPLVETVEGAAGKDHDPAKKMARQVDLLFSQSTSAEADSVSAEEDGPLAHLVSRDEAVDTVQRKWWEALDVDVRPAPLLCLASVAPVDVSTLDAETLVLARELLSHSTNSAGETEVARLRDNATARCEGRMGKGKGQRTCFNRLPDSQTQSTLREYATHTSSRGSCSTVPRGSSHHTERLLRLRGRCSSTAVVQRSEGELPEGEADSCFHQDQGRFAKDTAAGSHPPSKPESQCSNGCKKRLALGTVTPSETKDKVFSLSGALQGVLPTRSRGVTLSSTADMRIKAMRCREERILLRRYFASWLTAASQRHIQQRVASYHRFLMQCVRDTIGNAT
ncbi:hypothetical protein JKF63_02877 [Porcisia hertigi]|uniref:Uncharacterized protein n=1 Tax=Porcisia hertigi TaxID=2761500 RepID=A0A836L4L0_9TRYP|nr:hypothetical protein JKF63_02877 [Porcisia hertigi]